MRYWDWLKTSPQNNHFIWGSPGAGLTHLLQALCHKANQNNLSVQYLPINDIIGFDPSDICEGLDGVDIVCVDGLDLICGYRNWERALFNLFNNVKDAGHVMVFASHTSPQTLPVLLPDLKSRLLGCTIYHVEGLKDEEKQQALRMRASSRGMEMSEDVAKFILSRASRDTNELFFLLNRLDEASLREKRRLTIPFVKSVLGF